MLWLQIVQYAGFFFAQITNSVLVYLIITKAGKLFGSYRHVMCVFAMYSLIYSWIEVLTQPVMHIKGQVFIVYMDSPLKPYKWIGMEITCIFRKVIEKNDSNFSDLYCGLFALVISLLAAQFFYRYVAICREELRTIYNEDSETVPFIAPHVLVNRFKWCEEMENSRLPISGWSVCFSTILYCAFNIYWTMKKSQDHMSARTLELNHQLFVTLTFQTVLPFCMMYSPVGLLMTFPLFEVYVGKIANYVC
ncbi:hypothetical protein B9Z55_017861 [Caenorhabditis nigoni]|uniref:Uncharacterized protein n=1 Tax=Caenorhabditis nigoni TaxID=1611254 RepID=A0A2G5TBF0_9PELO|nr:hypothetical protein B9Z55_017861 [Caenorhabditis nigoni]